MVENFQKYMTPNVAKMTINDLNIEYLCSPSPPSHYRRRLKLATLPQDTINKQSIKVKENICKEAENNFYFIKYIYSSLLFITDYQMEKFIITFFKHYI